MSYVENKYKISAEIDPEKFNTVNVYAASFAGVKVRFYFEGKELEAVKIFLDSYLGYFEKFSGTEDISIHYKVLDNEFGHDNWEGWNNWSHELEYFSSDNNYDQLIERDFVAKIDKKSKNIFAIGPTWSRGTCDSLDNLLIYAIGRHLTNYNGLFLHAACVSDKEFAYVFFGASGAGKSTLAEFLYKNDNLSVMSSDQIILFLKDNKIYAHVAPTTIPEFPLEHIARDKSIREVKSIVHLIQREGSFQVSQLQATEWIQFFMRELIFRPEFATSQKLLDLVIKMANTLFVYKGEMSYSKSVGFWSDFQLKIQQGNIDDK